MTVAADPIKDDAGNANARIEACNAERHRCCGLCLSCHVEHEQNRQTQVNGEFRRGAFANRTSASTIEQAHGRLDHQEVCARRRLMGDAGEERRTHGPAVEIEARSAGGSGVERGVNIVGAAFGGTDTQAAPVEGCEQSERHGGLAGARARCSDENRLRVRPHHTTISGTRAARSSSFCLTRTMAMMANASNSSSRVSAATRWSSEMRMRFLDRVAEATTATGSWGSRPASMRKAAMPSRLRRPI